MMEKAKWRTGGVTVVRAESLSASMRASGKGRATAVDFVGTGRQKTWIGLLTFSQVRILARITMAANEVAVYVVKGRSEIR